MRVIVTGAVGFIGHSVCHRLLCAGHTVYGVDSVNDYYDPLIKLDRLRDLQSFHNFFFLQENLAERFPTAISSSKIDAVIHLAAQAGVRYSLTNPKAYIQSNVVGFQNVIDFVASKKIPKFIYASSSSVYGNSPCPETGWSEEMECLPSNLYGATKKANELVAAAYCETDKLNAIGLRFFSVYGPNGRPDMFLTSAIAKAKIGQPITLFCDDGDDMLRDWTHISDITAGIILSLESGLTGHHVFNLAAANPVSVVKTAIKINEHYQSDGLLLAAGRQAGEISLTRGNIDKARNILGYLPLIPFQDGLAQLLAAES